MQQLTKVRVEDFMGGWLVGDFIPSIFQSKDLEVGIKSFSAGDTEPEHYQMIATEVTVVIKGRCLLAGEQLDSGDVLIIPPGMSGHFRAETDVVLLVLKNPSLPQDKMMGRPEDHDE